MDTIKVQDGNYKFQDVLINGVNTKCLVPETPKLKFNADNIKPGVVLINTTHGDKVHYMVTRDQVRDTWSLVLIKDECTTNVGLTFTQGNCLPRDQFITNLNKGEWFNFK